MKSDLKPTVLRACENTDLGEVLRTHAAFSGCSCNTAENDTQGAAFGLVRMLQEDKQDGPCMVVCNRA